MLRLTTKTRYIYENVAGACYILHTYINWRVKQTRVKEMNFHHLLKRSRNTKWKKKHTNFLNLQDKCKRTFIPSVGAAAACTHNTTAHVSFPIATLHHVYTSRSTFSLVKPVFIQIWKCSFRLSIEWLRVVLCGRWNWWLLYQEKRLEKKKLNFIFKRPSHWIRIL